ncbi:MAG: hypothetical protein DSY87_00785, partial [Methylococcus sp.]
MCRRTGRAGIGGSGNRLSRHQWFTELASKRCCLAGTGGSFIVEQESQRSKSERETVRSSAVKYLIYLLATFLVVVGAAFYLRDLVFTSENPGHVLIGYGNWQIETSLYFSLAALVLAFVVLYIMLRLLLSTIRLPSILKKRSLAKRSA